MIVATAGHVDHGKTSLLRALTGIDGDRLAEERRRGMTIDLGFTHADLGAGAPAGFVDVPGHERFVRNMLAGVAAIDVALLVVAADDGPMPQTLEHLAVLDLLGIARGVVALTKADRVDTARLQAVAREVDALLRPTALASAPCFAVSAATGAGIDALREHLAALQRALPARATGGHFRFAVDRSFALAGAGRIVTGAVLSGCVRPGDEVVVAPQGVALRVRGIEVHGADAPEARAGQRAALNLAGAELKRADPQRGDWLVAPAVDAPTQRLDVRLRWLPDAPRALVDGALLQLHLGAASRETRVSPLPSRRLEPGAEGLAQLVLDHPVSALRGDRFVLRDAAAQRVGGGGSVVDPFAPARGRARPERLAELDALAAPTPQDALPRLLAARPHGIDGTRFVQAWNLDDAALAALLQQVPVHRVVHGGESRWLAPEHWQALGARIEQAVQRWHDAHPESVGPGDAALAAALAPRPDAPLFAAALRERVACGALQRVGMVLKQPSHRPRLAEADAVLLQRVGADLLAFGMRPPPLGEMAPRLGIAADELLSFLQRAAALGHLVQVARNRFFLPPTLDALVQVAHDLAAASPDGSFDAATFRDRSGLGRNLTIQLLEFFDRCGITRYAAERRHLAGR